MSQPIDGIDEKGERVGNPKHELLFTRVFSEAVVKVKTIEGDPNNPRYGKPVMYSVTFDTTTPTRDSSGETKSTKTSQEKNVHWSRVIHLADNRKSSEVYGVPRMQTLFNRLYDIRKIAGGSGEMFWKGGFPGFSFEMDANARPLTDAQKTALREEIANWMDGLQRAITTQGVKANSLDPQLADPKSHVETQLELISIALGIPKRIFMGAEQAKLASTQDTISWNKRVARRQNKYLSPYVVRPLIDRLIILGVLPEPKDMEYNIVWPDLDTPSDQDKADVMGKQTEAFSKYVNGGVDALIPEEIFLKLFAGLSADQVKEIMEAAQKREKELEDATDELEDEEPPMPPEPDEDEEEEEEEE